MKLSVRAYLLFLALVRHIGKKTRVVSKLILPIKSCLQLISISSSSHKNLETLFKLL